MGKSCFIFCFKLSEYYCIFLLETRAVLAVGWILENVVTQVSFIEAIHQERVSVSTEKHPMCSRSHLHLASLHYIRPLFED